MAVKEKARHILVELKGHAPFTILGALLGIFFMLIFRNLGGMTAKTLFSVFHPLHVVFSAMVTAAMFKVHAFKKHLVLVLLVGYFGSVGVATLSDIVIPHFGGNLLGLDVPTEAQIHETGAASHEHKIHLGFIEEWYLVNPAALLGILIAYILPHTKFPHTGHVLISTWASSSYLLMNTSAQITAAAAAGIFVTLFIAIWLPCCLSDIVFPLLFVKSDIELAGPCPVHGRHSHPHIHKPSESNELDQ